MHIVVHGAGIFGLSIAWTCTQRGARVTVVDPNGPGAGTSGGLVGALSPHVPENWNTTKAQQFRSLDMAESFWSGVAEASGSDPGYARLGRIQPLADEAAVALARERARTAEELWEGRYRWEVLPADGFADLVESPSGYVVHDTLSARLHPRMALGALVQALEAKGAEITTEPCEGDTSVHATGVAGLMELNGLAGEKTVGTGVKGQAALLDCNLGPVPHVFCAGTFVIPHADGRVAVGSTSEREWDDPLSTDDQLDEVIERARTLCPAIREAQVVERWAGLRPRTRSRAPMLGPHPLHEGAFIANGGFKIGFGMAPLVAELMADLVVEGMDRIPPEFRPEASLS
jgi:glycine/D-amino acid oxidase-like deaminating enzyme